jgi:hypothetical protein
MAASIASKTRVVNLFNFPVFTGVEEDGDKMIR